MILVADSGATKCDWMTATPDHKSSTINTMGFSPFFHTRDFIAEKILENSQLADIRHKVDAVFYYGTGCSSDDRKKLIKDSLQSVYEKADVLVDHDLLGAALAANLGKEGIACILGTGSNSCYYDGEKIYEAVPALGHKMGDEGSGAYFGKKLLALYLYKRLPAYIHEVLRDEYKLTKEGIFQVVYHEGHENVYFASFMKSLSNHKDDPWVIDFMYKGLYKFADIHISCYDNYKEVPVNFVGSIAHYFRHILEKVADDMGFTIGRIERKPIFSMVDYHLAQLAI